MENIQEFVKEITNKYEDGDATEHTYRAALERLIRGVSCDKLKVLNEGKVNELHLGKPDLIVKKGDILIGCVEAKDINKELSNKAYEEQFKRYRNGIENLIITNCLDWEFYKDGKLKDRVTIGFLSGKGVETNEEKFERLLSLLRKFTEYKGLKITSPRGLAERMASRTRALKIGIISALRNGSEKSTMLYPQYEFFKKHVMKGLKVPAFSDMYAQTITYGLFVARLNNNTSNFSRKEALEGISCSNFLLEGLFNFLVQTSGIDESLNWDIDNLIDLFGRTDLQSIFAKHDKKDLFIHFYEDFLEKYDKKTKKSHGVFYTPVEIVKYIVNATDEILQTEFKLDNGLADTTKTTYKYLQGADEEESGGEYLSKETDKVQILDPATGTGTFLVEVIKKIYEKCKGMPTWNDYVERNLLNNIHGFELLMTPYVMCNLKLSIALSETGYTPINGKDKKYNIFLTNALDNIPPDRIPIFRWLDQDNEVAHQVKNYRPIKVVIGNPPYNKSSFNKSKFITDLISVYKDNLEEAGNKNALSDDYVKFIRIAENYVSRNKDGGIVAFITSNTFLEALTCRTMRKHLLGTFDKIYVLNLHGRLMPKEVSPDGVEDENVFGIKQGVSINIFVKTSNSNDPARVYYMDLYGSRKSKFEWLKNSKFSETNFVELKPKDDNYFFAPKNFSTSLQEEYGSGFALNDLFIEHVCATQTKKDALFVDHDEERLRDRVRTLLVDKGNYPAGFAEKYELEDSPYLLKKIQKTEYDKRKTTRYSYRPFELKYVYYDKILGRASSRVMKHIIDRDNVALCTTDQLSTSVFRHVLVTSKIPDMCYLSSYTKESAIVYPLYLYSPMLGKTQKTTNFKEKEGSVLEKIERKLGIKLNADFTPENLFDYIYAILHSNKYRTKYNDLLKIGLPRIPYPETREYFFNIADCGERLRNIHLLTPGALSAKSPFYVNVEYTKSGNNVVYDVRFEDNKVYVNGAQYFENVSKAVWDFYIGGYQPLQKWLKDRKNRTLSHEDIDHYKKMVNAIAETIRIMDEIDRVIQL